MRRILFIALALLSVAAAFLVWFVQDPNRFKTALLAYVEDETGVRVEIRGDLAWRFRPHLWLAVERLYAVHDGFSLSLERLSVRPGIGSLVRNPSGPDRWRIEEAVAEGLAIKGARGRIQAPRLSAANIGPGKPAPVEARVVYMRETLEPIGVDVTGTLTVDTGRFSARNLSFRMSNAAGVCDLQAMPNGKLWPPLAPEENGILSVATMRAYDWDGRCDLERIEHGGETIENVTLVLDNKEGGSIVTVDAPEFLGGEAQLDVVIAAGASPVTWDVRPVLVGVDSSRLAAWLGGSGAIAATLDYGGTIRMTGNTPAALAASIEAETRFSTGSGELDGKAFAAPLAKAAALWNGGGPATALPDRLPFESLSGVWTVDGERHKAQLELDGLMLETEGDYALSDDRLSLRGVIVPGNAIERWGLKASPALADAAFHFQCDGSAAAPNCAVDVKRTLLDAGASEGSATARELIDAHVPEEYRAVARTLLDSLEAQVDSALRKDPEDLIEEHVPKKYQGVAQSLLDTLGEALEEEN